MDEFADFYNYINIRCWIHIVAVTKQIQAAKIVGIDVLSMAYRRTFVSDED
jgi:hypothetical protein